MIRITKYIQHQMQELHKTGKEPSTLLIGKNFLDKLVDESPVYIPSVLCMTTYLGLKVVRVFDDSYTPEVIG
jgi:hypothetical protein